MPSLLPCRRRFDTPPAILRPFAAAADMSCRCARLVIAADDAAPPPPPLFLDISLLRLMDTPPLYAASAMIQLSAMRAICALICARHNIIEKCYIEYMLPVRRTQNAVDMRVDVIMCCLLLFLRLRYLRDDYAAWRAFADAITPPATPYAAAAAFDADFFIF